MSNTPHHEQTTPNSLWRVVDYCKNITKPGLFSLTEGCQCPNHYPASVAIPTGMAYRHICSSCQAEVIIVPQGIPQTAFQYPLHPDEMTKS